MSGVVQVSPAEAARRARWFRQYAAIAETDRERIDRLAKADAYQAQAVCGTHPHGDEEGAA